jgi:prepilin-type N-terminal cleavage/methylation domain-containing protein
MKRSSPNPRGFTLVELLVVIAIIGVLVAMSLPAIMASREMGRRNLCQANVAQLLLAMGTYEDAFECYPSGVINPEGPIKNEPEGLHQSWTISMLPYLDELVVYKLFDAKASVYAPENAQVRGYWPRMLICPSEPLDVAGTSNYAGCHNDVEAPIDTGNSGVLFLNSRIRQDEVTDGLRHTLFLSEKLAEAGDLGWLSGTRATLRNTGSPPNSRGSEESTTELRVEEAHGDKQADTFVGGFASAHAGGLHVGFGDGHVEFYSDNVDQQVWQRLGNRGDGHLPETPPRD